VHADYLWHPVMLADDEAFFMPLYFGVGARLLDHDRGNEDDDFHLGARVPVILTSRADNVRMRIGSAAVAKLVVHARRAAVPPLK